MQYLKAEIIDVNNGTKRIEYCLCEDFKNPANSHMFMTKFKIKMNETVNLVPMQYEEWEKESSNVGWILD